MKYTCTKLYVIYCFEHHSLYRIAGIFHLFALIPVYLNGTFQFVFLSIIGAQSLKRASCTSEVEKLFKASRWDFKAEL